MKVTLEMLAHQHSVLRHEFPLRKTQEEMGGGTPTGTVRAAKQKQVRDLLNPRENLPQVSSMIKAAHLHAENKLYSGDTSVCSPDGH